MARVIFAAFCLIALSAGAFAAEDCSLCQALIGAIEKELENNGTQSDIIVILDRLCKYVPDFGPTCDAIVAAGIPTVINWVEVHENATKVCQQLKLCPTSGQEDTPRRACRGMKNADCDACQSGIGFVEHWLSENATQSWIEKELEASVCKLIPNIEATCDAITENGLPTVIDWIQTHENSTVVCQQLKICTSELLRNREHGYRGFWKHHGRKHGKHHGRKHHEEREEDD